jgi:hypothetical protein
VTPIYDQLVAERGDPRQFASHEASCWQPWQYAVDKVFDLSAAPATRAKGRPKTPKRRRR